MTADGVLKGLFYLVLILNYIVLVSPVFSSRKDAYKEMSTARSWLAPQRRRRCFSSYRQISQSLSDVFCCSCQPDFFLFSGIRH